MGFSLDNIARDNKYEARENSEEKRNNNRSNNSFFFIYHSLVISHALMDRCREEGCFLLPCVVLSDDGLRKISMNFVSREGLQRDHF